MGIKVERVTLISGWSRLYDNFDRLMLAFADFGLPTSAIDRDLFLNGKEIDVFTFGSSTVAIDFMTSVKGLEFGEAIAISIPSQWRTRGIA